MLVVGATARDQAPREVFTMDLSLVLNPTPIAKIDFASLNGSFVSS